MSTSDPIGPALLEAQATDTRQAVVLRHLLRVHLPGTVVLFGMYAVGVALVGWLIHLFATVDRSIWSGALQLPRWYALGFGVYVTAVYLPLYVAHGRTRREVAVASAWLVVAVAALLSALTALGFAVEAGIYRGLGWHDALTAPHPLGTLTAIGGTLATQGAVYLVFLMAGALGGVAFYRGPGLGALVVPPGLLMLAVGGSVAYQDGIGPLPLPLPAVLTEPSAAAGVGACLVAALVGAALTWRGVRDVPLRSRST